MTYVPSLYRRTSYCPVSIRVNVVRYDDAACLAPVESPPEDKFATPVAAPCGRQIRGDLNG